MSNLVGRRVFITRGAASTAVALGLVASCAPLRLAPAPVRSRRPTIGYMSPDMTTKDQSPLWPELAQLGWRLGDNVELEFRFTYADTVTSVANELVQSAVSLILVQGEPSAQAAKAATDTIPIVMIGVSDALAAGLVSNLARPGGNVTGMTMLGPEVAAKRLDLLHDLAPGVTKVAVLWHPLVPDTAHEFENLERAAKSLGIALRSLQVAASTFILRQALTAIRPGGVEGLVVSNMASLWEGRETILQTAANGRIPAIYPNFAWVERGGLISYGPDYASIPHQVAVQIDKILRGVRPADIPVERPRSFECGVNTNTIQKLGLTISPALESVTTRRAP